MALIAKWLFALRIPRDYMALQNMHGHFYIAFNYVKFQFDNIKCSNSLGT